MAAAPRYLLTGATGFLGREVLVRLLHLGAPVLVTTRRRDGEELDAARERLVEMAAKTDATAPIERLTVAFADVTAPDLAFSANAARWIEQDAAPVQIVHGAAEVRFDLPWDVMHLQNVAGTEHVITFARQLADRGRLHRLDHVSTTFIAGDRTDVALESEIEVGQKPRNDYERSKLEAELSIDAARKSGLPITVHRPSIIVGDSRTGRASSFKVLYWPMRVYARGRWRTIFGRPDCTIDVVPVDYVASAMIHLFRVAGAVGKTYHLAAGPERQSTIVELVQIAEEIFANGKVRYIDPDVYMNYLRPIVKPILKLFRPDIAERGGVFLPYFRSNPSFAVEQAAEALEPAGLAPPRVRDYFGTIVRYAKDSDFGKSARVGRRSW